MKIKGIDVKVDRLAEFNSAVKELTKNACYVGYPEETTGREPTPDDPVPITNAGLAFIQDNGAPEANIPPRPFMHPGINDAKDPIEKRLKTTALQALDGDVFGVKKGLMAVGLTAQASIRAKITDGPFIPLKPATLAARRRKGFMGVSPLIVTGQLRRAVNFVIRPSK